MAKYRKIELVDAVQWFDGGDHPQVYVNANGVARTFGADGGNLVNPGDWIVTDRRGNCWQVPEAEFAVIYESAECF